MALFVTPRQLNQHAELYNQLGMMIAAGMTVFKALELLGQNPPSNDLRRPIAQWLEELHKGNNVADSLRNIEKWVPSFNIALIDAAERSGRLDACFKLLAVYYRERAQTVRQMLSDSAYPLFVFNFAIILFPVIELVQKGNLTRFLWETLGIAAPLYGIVAAIIYACQGRHGEQWRSVIEQVLARIPVLGTARRDLALARLATALESLLSGGVPILTAWPMAATASGSPALNRTVQSWKQPLEDGSTPSELLSKSKDFPQLFSSMYHTAEISGTIDETLVRLHTLYQTEGMAKIKNLSQWTPKVVYFGIMIFVGWKIISG